MQYDPKYILETTIKRCKNVFMMIISVLVLWIRLIPFLLLSQFSKFLNYNYEFLLEYENIYMKEKIGKIVQ